MDGSEFDDMGQGAKVGPQWTDVVLGDGTVVTAADQRLFREFASQAHTVGVSIRNDKGFLVLEGYREAALEYFEQRSYSADHVARVREALDAYECFPVGLPTDSPLNHLSRVGNDFVDTDLAALDPGFSESGLAADLLRVLGHRKTSD